MCQKLLTKFFLLGWDFLNKHNFIIDLNNNSQHSSSENVTLFNLGTDEIKSCQQVLAATNLAILIKREMILEGFTEETENFSFGLIESSDNVNLPREIIMASTLVDLSNGTIPVRVMNVSVNQKSLKRVRF